MNRKLITAVTFAALLSAPMLSVFAADNMNDPGTATMPVKKHVHHKKGMKKAKADASKSVTPAATPAPATTPQ